MFIVPVRTININAYMDDLKPEAMYCIHVHNVHTCVSSLVINIFQYADSI